MQGARKQTIYQSVVDSWCFPPQPYSLLWISLPHTFLDLNRNLLYSSQPLICNAISWISTSFCSTRDPKRKRPQWRRIWSFLKNKWQGDNSIPIACRDNENILCFSVFACVKSMCLEWRTAKCREAVFGGNLKVAKEERNWWRRGQINVR